MGKSDKLWNRNFILLVQGRFVSLFGSILYSVALGFWVLDKTGSGTVMGTLMAVSALPRVLVAPFAGPLIDKLRKNRILVYADLVCGLAVIASTVIIYMGLLEVWMVFVVAIITGAASAFFHPASTAIVPDLVPEDKITNAGSVNSMVNSATEIFASPAGSIMYAAFGAPLIFLINGISYIASAISELFIKVRRDTDVLRDDVYSYWDDFKSGVKYAVSHIGVRNFYLLASFMNFMLSASIVTLMPYFQRTESLGVEKYGFVMSAFTLGMFLGGLLMSFLKVGNKNRFRIFFASMVICLICLALSLIFGYVAILIFFFIGGFFLVIVNIIISATLQLIIDPGQRGKFFAFASSISAGLAPLGMALGGFLSDSLPVPVIFLAINLIVLVVFVAVISMSAATRGIFTVPEKETPPVETGGV